MKGFDKEQLAQEASEWIYEKYGITFNEVSKEKWEKYYQEFLNAYPEPDAIDEYKRAREQGY